MNNQCNVNDVIIWPAIEAHSKRGNQFTQTNLVCLEQNSLSRYCQVSSRWPTMAFYDAQNFLQGFSLHIRKSYSSRSRAHLAVSNFHLKQVKAVCVIEFIFHQGSLYDYVIHIALIATLRMSLITSFQLHLHVHAVRSYGVQLQHLKMYAAMFNSVLVAHAGSYMYTCRATLSTARAPTRSNTSIASGKIVTYSIAHCSAYQRFPKMFWKTSACRDGTVKNQPNEMGMTPKYFRSIPTFYAILPTMHCFCYLCAQEGCESQWGGGGSAA